MRRKHPFFKVDALGHIPPVQISRTRISAALDESNHVPRERSVSCNGLQKRAGRLFKAADCCLDKSEGDVGGCLSVPVFLIQQWD